VDAALSIALLEGYLLQGDGLLMKAIVLMHDGGVSDTLVQCVLVFKLLDFKVLNSLGVDLFFHKDGSLFVNYVLKLLTAPQFELDLLLHLLDLFCKCFIESLLGHVVVWCMTCICRDIYPACFAYLIWITRLGKVAVSDLSLIFDRLRRLAEVGCRSF